MRFEILGGEDASILKNETLCFFRTLVSTHDVTTLNRVPQHTCGGAGGERMYSSYSFTTSALDGVNGQRQAPAAFYPRGKEAG
jgi:hypothetical protein